MATNNLKEFANQWILLGLLFFSLVSFAIYFTANNNPDALGSSGDRLSGFGSDIQSRLVVVEDDTDALLNISSQTNPEVSRLGSRDSVATSYGITGNSRSFWVSIKLFMGWILTGTSGQILISVFGGLFGFTVVYYIAKFIRGQF